MQYKKLILSCLILLNAITITHAQRAEIGINAGGAGYIGDFNQFNPVKISGLNGGVYAKINIDPYWGVGLHYNYGRIKGNDASSNNAQLRERNLNFSTSLNEIAFIGSFNFIDMYSPGSKKRLSPYLFAGVGGVIFEPKGNYDGLPTYELNDLKSEGQLTPYRTYSLVIPYGAGIKYKKSDYWTIFAQIGYRQTFTDYLDDVSGKYYWPNGATPITYFPPYIGSTAPDAGIAGTQRGDFRKRDTYVFVNIGISYTFVSQKCFTF